MFQAVDITIRGVEGNGLIVHNGLMADPTNQYSLEIKKISAKGKKTEEDHEAMARLEWEGGLYLEKGQIVIPSDCIEAMFVEGAKKLKLGKVFKAFLLCQSSFPLLYPGPTDLDQLYAHEQGRHQYRRIVRVGQARVLRTRPFFPEWSLEFQVFVDTEFLELDQVEQVLNIAASQTGFCERRPKHGRFDIERFDAGEAGKKAKKKEAVTA